MAISLTDQDRIYLLQLARSAIASRLQDREPPDVDLSALSPPLRQEAACFVTLTLEGKLRGCVGSLEARQPLACEVRDRAVSAAFCDFRFPNLGLEELSEVHIQISCLSKPRELDYAEPGELVDRLTPGQDGVILSDGSRKATFLPQVWDQLPTPEAFLNRLCQKMGAEADLWRQKSLKVETYQVETFAEDGA